MAKKIEVQIIGDASSLQRALNDATGHTSKFGGALGALAKTGVLAAGAAGVGAVAITLRQGIKEYTEAAKVAAQTNAVIKSTGAIANVTAKDVDKLAESLMRKSGVDDEAIKTGENMILTFKNIRNEAGAGNDIFDQATLAVLDMDTAMTQGNVTAESMAKTSIRVGKALNDPIKGITALARVGVTFTEGQKEAIKKMVESGDIMGAQKMILKELTSEFGGSAEAIGKTMPKQLDKLKESFNNFAGDLVAKAIPSVQRFVDFLNTRLIPAEGFAAKIKVVWEGVNEVAQDLIAKLREQIHVLFTGQDVFSVQEKAMIHIDPQIQIDWGKLRQQFKDGFMSALASDSASQELGDKLMAGLARVGERLGAWAKSVPGMVVRDIKAAFNTADISADLDKFILGPLRAASGFVQTHVNRIVSVIRAVVNPIGAAAQLIGDKIVSGITGALGPLVGRVAAKLGEIAGAIASVAGQAFGWASRIGSQIISGVLSALGGLYGAVKGKIEGVLSSVLGSIDIPGFSPPEAAAAKAIGEPLGRGVIAGWIKSTATLPSKMSETLRNAIEKARATIEAARDRLGTAFDGLTSRILRAFDAESAGFETTHEKILREIDDRRQMEDLVQRQADAQIRLNEAIKEGDAAAIAAAQRDLTRASEDIERVGIEAKAAEERKNLDSLREEQRIHLEKKLAALEASFVKEGASVKKAMAAMAKLMASFGIDFETAGALVGEAFVAGLRASLGAAASAAAGVGRAVPGPSSFSPAAAGGGGSTVILNNYAPINSQQQLDDMVQSAAARLRNSGRLPV